jgi:hypothetical protein
LLAKGFSDAADMLPEPTPSDRSGHTSIKAFRWSEVCPRRVFRRHRCVARADALPDESGPTGSAPSLWVRICGRFYVARADAFPDKSGPTGSAPSLWVRICGCKFVGASLLAKGFSDAADMLPEPTPSRMNPVPRVQRRPCGCEFVGASLLAKDFQTPQMCCPSQRSPG